MATHSSVLAWRIPRTEEPVGCRLWGRTESDITDSTSSSIGIRRRKDYRFLRWLCYSPGIRQHIRGYALREIIHSNSQPRTSRVRTRINISNNWLKVSRIQRTQKLGDTQK